MKKLTALLLSMVILLSIGTVAFAADGAAGSANHFNVMLVVDATGSLIGLRGSDPSGLRYDAIKLFLGLLTEKGNNVGAVVFDDGIMLDIAPMPMEKLSDKNSLAKEIEYANIGDGTKTNIVKALDAAVADLEGLTEKNGLPSVVLLLTDGNDNTLRQDTADALRETVIETAKSNEISINAIMLNKGGTGNPESIRDYSDLTDGWFEEVDSAESLADAFRRFYMVINNVEYSGEGATELDDNGYAERTFEVPAYGVEEVNIVLDISNPIYDIQIEGPADSHYSRAMIDDLSMITSKYQLIKLPDPDYGSYLIKIKGNPGSTVDVKMLYSCAFEGTLLSRENPEEYLHDVEYAFDCVVTDPNTKLTKDIFATMQAKLCVKSVVSSDVEKIDMLPTDEGYTVSKEFKSGTYELYVEIGPEGGEFSKKTNIIQVSVDNGVPVAGDDIEATVKTGLFQEGLFSFDLSDYFTDPEGKELEYEFEGGILKDKMERDGDIITIDCLGIEKASMKITAIDDQEAEASIELKLTEDNVTAKYLIIAGIAAAAVAAAIIAYKAWRRSLKCTLEIVMEAFDNDAMEFTNYSVYSFHGRYPMSKVGQLYGANSKDCWLEATKDRNKCFFVSKKPFTYGGVKTKKAEIPAGSTVKIYFNRDNTVGLQIEAERPFE